MANNGQPEKYENINSMPRGPENGADNLRAEAFSTSDASSASARLNQKAQELYKHLENANAAVRQGGPEAAITHYTAAIKTADSFDQDALKTMRLSIKKVLDAGELDREQRRALLERDSELHSLERAPGFARANFALMLIRHGEQFNGTRLLLHAQEKDPEMASDPNFIRHLNKAITDGASTSPRDNISNNLRQQETRQVPPQYGMVDDPRPSRAVATRNEQAPLPQDVPRPQHLQFSPPEQFVPPSPSPASTDQSIKQPKFSTLDAQGRTPVQVAQNLLSQVESSAALTPAMQQQFKNAIANADEGLSPRFKPYVEKQAESASRLNNFAQANPAIIGALQKIDNTAASMIERMQPQQQATAYKLFNQLDRVATPQERAGIKQQLAAMDPAFSNLLDQRERTMGPALQQILNDQARVQNAIESQFQSPDNQAEFNQSALTRYSYALALEKTGNAAEAKRYLAEAEMLNNSQDPAQNEAWRRTAARLGLAQPNEAKESQQSGMTDARQAQPNPSASAAESLLYNVRKFQADTESGVSAAASFQQLKPGFEQSIAKSDAEFEATMKKVPEFEKRAAELNSQTTPEHKAALQAFGTQLQAEKSKMTPQDLKAAEQYQNVDLSAQERNLLRQHLTKVAPNFVNLTDKLEAQVGKSYLSNVNQMFRAEQEIAGAVSGRFMTRFHMAQCADKAGESSLAKTKMVEALASVPAQSQQEFLTQSEVSELATKVGLRPEHIPVAPDALLSKVVPVQEKSKSDIATVSGINESNVGLSPQEIFEDGRRMLRAEGMTAATKKQFEDGIKVADSLFNNNDAKDAELLLTRLKTGKKENGEEVSTQERVHYHELLNQTFGKSIIGILLRDQYAQYLVEHKQNQSAQKMRLESIELADKLPLQLFRGELEQLSRDAQNPQLDRRAQRSFGIMFEQIGGTGVSKSDGLLFLPISTRKQAANFYVSAKEDGTGIFKPDLAIQMVNETRAAEERLYKIDLTKNPNADPELREMAAKLKPLASEELRKQKTHWDSYWSNGLVDAGVGAAAITAVCAGISLYTRNPAFFKWAMAGDKAALSLTAKVGAGALAVGGATAGRHYLHEAITGEKESWGTSLIHGTAGVAAVGGIYATRGAVNQALFRGATEEGALARIVEARGALAEGAAVGSPKVLKVGELSEYYASAGIRVPKETVRWMAENKDLVVAAGRTVDSAVFNSCKLGLNPAQAANLAGRLAPVSEIAATEGAVSTATPFLTRMGEKSLAGVKNVFVPFTKVDLATASASQLNMRAFWGNWAQATAGISAFESTRALDRDINPNTGEKYSYAESLWNANFGGSPMHNVFVRGLMLSPWMKNGALPMNYYAKEAHIGSRAYALAKSPFTSTGVGAITARSGYLQHGIHASYLGFSNFTYDFTNVTEMMRGKSESNQVRNQLEQSNRPIENLQAPGVRTYEIPNVVPADGAYTPQATAPQNNGEPLRDEPAPRQNPQPGLKPAGLPELY